MALNSKGAAAGGLSGFTAGAMTGNPYAAIGMGATGALAGALSPDQQPTGYSKGDLDSIAQQRFGEIADFRNQLASVRQRYLAQLPQFQAHAMSRFMPQLEAQYANRGLQVSGGAFGSALGRKAGDFQAEQMLAAPQMEAQDLTTVANMMGQVRNAQLGGGYSNFAGPTPPNPIYGAAGNFLGQAGMAYMGNQFNQSRDANLINLIRQARQNGSSGSSLGSGMVVPISGD